MGRLNRASSYGSVNMGSPKGREAYGDGVPNAMGFRHLGHLSVSCVKWRGVTAGRAAAPRGLMMAGSVLAGRAGPIRGKEPRDALAPARPPTVTSARQARSANALIRLALGAGRSGCWAVSGRN
jgi:hypothetical protein